VSLIYNQGIKISKIAEFSEDEIIKKTREFGHSLFLNDKALVSLKLCMYNFDSVLFNQIYYEQIQVKTFSEVFQEVFIPFLHFIGLQWQTSALKPAHEHFISNLIYQKIQLNIENLNWDNTKKSGETYILFLPEEEMHENGILYLNYELLLRGLKTIYLGRSIPLEDLEMLNNQHENLIWISQFTVAPNSKNMMKYLVEVEKLLLAKNKFWAISQLFSTHEYVSETSNLKTFSSIREVISNIKI
jgi:methanogenic corrinoid protein MtbC1